MAEDRWTDATQDLVADLLYHGRDGDGHVDAIRILTALADAGLLVAPSTAQHPRTWTLPPEPGPEVTAVRDHAGRSWRRSAGQALRGLWVVRHPVMGTVELARDWGELLMHFAPLTDATERTTP